MIEQISSQAEIENLYKEGSNAPYTPVKNGYGYYGVLLSHKETGRIHCHLCGQWFKSLGAHVSQAHKIRAKQYRKKFGFSLTQPICSEETSRKSSLLAFAKVKAGKIGAKFGKKNLKKYAAVGHKSTLAYWNKNSICPEQVKQRVINLSDKIEHFPSLTELKTHDVALFNIILRRYKTWNKFKKEIGIPIYNGNVPQTKKIDKGKIIYALREFGKNKKRVPLFNDYKKESRINKYPAVDTVIRHFGSWNRALHAAGLNVKG